MSSRKSKPSPLEPKGHGSDDHAKKTHVSEHIPIRGQNYLLKIRNLLREWIDLKRNSNFKDVAQIPSIFKSNIDNFL